MQALIITTSRTAYLRELGPSVADMGIFLGFLACDCRRYDGFLMIRQRPFSYHDSKHTGELRSGGVTSPPARQAARGAEEPPRKSTATHRDN
jgi:hypothetical protein